MASDRSIPIIDLSGIDTQDGMQRIQEELMQAAETMGFFQIVNHGISQADIDHTFDLEARFFGLPDDIKARYPFDTHKYLGWCRPKAQTSPSTGLPDIVESMGCGYGARMEPLWPTEEDCPGYKIGKQKFQKQCHHVLLQLLSLLANGLGLPDNFFEEALDPSAEDNQCNLRCNHSPSVEGLEFPAGSFRTAPHTDFSTITLLFQRLGQGGLEVVPGREAVTQYAMGDNWTPVPPTEGAIVCNIGDQLMWWSDDRFKSNYHRVRLPNPAAGEYCGERFSIAYFSNPRKSTIIQGPQKKYPAMTGAQVLEARGAAHRAALAARHLGPKAAATAMQAAIAHIVSDATAAPEVPVLPAAIMA